MVKVEYVHTVILSTQSYLRHVQYVVPKAYGQITVKTLAELLILEEVELTKQRQSILLVMVLERLQKILLALILNLLLIIIVLTEIVILLHLMISIGVCLEGL